MGDFSSQIDQNVAGLNLNQSQFQSLVTAKIDIDKWQSANQPATSPTNDLQNLTDPFDHPDLN